MHCLAKLGSMAALARAALACGLILTGSAAVRAVGGLRSPSTTRSAAHP